MSTESLFYYRRLTPKKKEEEGFDITEIWDSFNPFRILRGWWSTPEVFSVRLDDGHEETHDVPKLIGKNGKRESVKEKGWFITQIDMCKEDADRLRKATELYPYGQYMVENLHVGSPLSA
jgi:hypothetical protein